MFHRFTGKTFFYIVSLLFMALSIQNTWQFLVTILPDATEFFVACMMVVFEAGFMGWLALLMYGADNVPRVIVSALMLLVTGIGVFTGAYYEFDEGMHKSIAVKIDPALLTNVPTIVKGVYIATGVAILCYILASPAFFARMKHMNTHGTAPVMLPREVTGHLVSVEQTGEMPALSRRQEPIQIAGPEQLIANQAKEGWFSRARQGLGNALIGNKRPSEPEVYPALPQYTEEFQAMFAELMAERKARQTTGTESDPLAQPRSEE